MASDNHTRSHSRIDVSSTTVRGESFVRVDSPAGAHLRASAPVISGQMTRSLRIAESGGGRPAPLGAPSGKASDVVGERRAEAPQQPPSPITAGMPPHMLLAASTEARAANGNVCTLESKTPVSTPA